MKQEYSYGAVVYRFESTRLMILIEFMKLGHISLPKGHIEKGETPEECALREIREETNLEVSLNTAFSHTITYFPIPGVRKDVTFYLATPITEYLIPQESEVNHLEWVEESRALALLTHDSDREVLKDAISYIHAHEKR